MSVTELPSAPTGRTRNRPRRTPKGRQIDLGAASEIAALLGDRSRQRDLLIEHLHLIQDKHGCISSAHLTALAAEMKLAQTEIYEVATFYAHFDVVADGAGPTLVGTGTYRLRAGGRGARALIVCCRICRKRLVLVCALSARPAWAPAITHRSVPSVTFRSTKRLMHRSNRLPIRTRMRTRCIPVPTSNIIWRSAAIASSRRTCRSGPGGSDKARC